MRKRLSYATLVTGLTLSPGWLSAQLSGVAQTVLSPLEQEALRVFNPGGKTFTSITFQGSVKWIQGSLQDQGTVTLKAWTDGSTSETWNLGTIPHSYTSSAFSGTRTCTATNAKGVAKIDRSAECLRALPWFAPGLNSILLTSSLLNRAASSIVSAPSVSQQQTTYFTRISTSGPTMTKGVPELSALTAVRVSYDPLFLLSQLDYDYAIDSDLSHVIPYRVVFSQYRLENGLMVPHRIERYLQRTLQTDITITAVILE